MAEDHQVQIMTGQQYSEWVTDLLSEDRSPRSYGRRIVFPARRYLPAEPQSSRDAIPLPLAGYTIITPPNNDDSVNAPAYESLCPAWEALKAVPGLVPAPRNAWHMTLADLVSQAAYAKLLAEDKETDLASGVSDLFKSVGGIRKCEMSIKGVGLFPDCAVALLHPTQASYTVLLDFRRRVYESQDLRDLGVTRSEPYGFHITLAYVEAYLVRERRTALTNALREINTKWPAAGVSFTVHMATLSTFDNMSEFGSTQGWKRKGVKSALGSLGWFAGRSVQKKESLFGSTASNPE